MKQRMIRYAGRLCAAVLLLALVLAVSAAGAEVKPWDTMRNFKVKTLDGTTFELKKALEEKELVVIDLWYIDCGLCPAASASLQLASADYQDRVAFLSVNAFDGNKAIRLYTEGRGFTVPCAKYEDAARWSNMYPCFLIIDRDMTVLARMISCPSARAVREVIDQCLAMTPEQKAENKAADAFIGPKHISTDLSTPEGKREYAYTEAASYAYNLKNDMALEIGGDAVSRIVIDTESDALRFIERTGEYCIVPEGTPFTVTVKTEKDFKPDKAYMTAAHFRDVGTLTFNYSWNGVPGLIDDVPFKKAIKAKNAYTFELTGSGDDAVYFFVESGYTTDITKDSIVGLHTFTSEEQAKDYLERCSEKYGYEFTWHVEQEETP